MKHFILISVLAFCTSAFAQNEPVIYNLKKDSQEIVLSLPAGTIINDDNSIIINGFPATITAVEKSVYIKDSLQNKNDFRMLDAVFEENIKQWETNLAQKPIAMVCPIRDGKNGILCIEDFKDETRAAKVSGCMVAGDYILKISMERTVDQEKLTGSGYAYTHFILEILRDVIVMGNGKPIKPNNISAINKAFNFDPENPFSLSSTLIFLPEKN